ncbi:MAG: aldo/keto reductase [Hyphomonas sp.]
MNPDASTHPGQSLVLGTALWGWGIDKAEAFEMADLFIAGGGRLIDAATNYPINRNPEDFGKASAWIAEWLRLNPGSGLRVTAKIGSIDNTGGAATLLGPSFIGLSVSFLEAQFHDALAIVAVHWDNRESPAEIAGTLEAFREVRQRGFGIGFSGVKRPDLYAKLAPDLAGDWIIQVKENLRNCQARDHYSPHFPKAGYLAYGVNMGGLKLEGASGPGSSMSLRGIDIPAEELARVRSFLERHQTLSFAPSSMNELALLNAHFTPGISGVVMGPRNAEQLKQTMDYWGRLQQPDALQEWEAFQSALTAGAQDA